MNYIFTALGQASVSTFPHCSDVMSGHKGHLGFLPILGGLSYCPQPKRFLICRRSRTLLLANDIRRSWGLSNGWYDQISSGLFHSGSIRDGRTIACFSKNRY